MAGLLTYSLLGAFPCRLEVDTVAGLLKSIGDHSSGNCSGITNLKLYHLIPFSAFLRGIEDWHHSLYNYKLIFWIGKIAIETYELKYFFCSVK